MAVCNLFNKLSKTTGNFLLFSQYTEDLTRSNTHPGEFRVSPSHFIVMDIDYNKYIPFSVISETLEYQDPNVDTKNLNSDIPTYFQNYFENGCAFIRENSGKIVEKIQFPNWTPELSTNMFWSALYDTGLLTKTEDVCNEIKYIGDINIHTYDEHLGTGYSEIYCSIPSDSQAQKIRCFTQTRLDEIPFKDKTVLGYKSEEYKPETTNMCNLNLNNTLPFKYCFSPTFSLQYADSTEQYEIDSALKEYNFNTIILLYDTYDIGADGKYHLAYKNIPMGMYIAGTINNGTTTNEGKKIVSNPDIYEMGTSYGLRICSRFVVTPNNDNIKPIDVKVDCDSSYAATCMVLSELSKSITKMNEIAEQCVKNSQLNKEMLDLFKNSRTNVPYIKEIGGQNFWFINGRNTYVPSDGSATVGGIDSITRSYIDNLFEQMRLRMALGYR